MNLNRFAIQMTFFKNEWKIFEEEFMKQIIVLRNNDKL